MRATPPARLLALAVEVVWRFWEPLVVGIIGAAAAVAWLVGGSA